MTDVEQLVQDSPLAQEQKQHFLELIKASGVTKEFFDGFEAAVKAAQQAAEEKVKQANAEFITKAEAELDAAQAEFEAGMEKLDAEMDAANEKLKKDLAEADIEDARQNVAQS
jgi:hypothetical protein